MCRQIEQESNAEKQSKKEDWIQEASLFWGFAFSFSW